MDELQDFAKDFWDWRHVQAPVTRDDVPRMARPEPWVPKWHEADVQRYRRDLDRYAERLSALDLSGAGIGTQIDAKLMRSAVERARWELDTQRRWQTDPNFYVDQAIGAVYLLLLPLPPFEPSRIDALLRRLRNIPTIVAAARANLAGEMYQEFAEVAIGELEGIQDSLEIVATELCAAVDLGSHESDVREAFHAGGAALGEYREWLIDNLATAPRYQALGRDNFARYLKDIAVVPYDPEVLLKFAEHEWVRSVAFEGIYREYKRGPAKIAASTAAEQSALEEIAERSINDFYLETQLLTQPSDMRRYLNAPRPKYMEPLKWLGVDDDLTDIERMRDIDAVSYVPEPHDRLPYFERAKAQDCRMGVSHEGAHYKQLTWSWRHENPIRREYYDSTANEGIAFYNEELLLQAGLFQDAPRSRGFVLNYMRLRALRVSMDIRLALGAVSIEEAANDLERLVPLDHETAWGEAVMFAATPGLGMSYTIGKHQIINFIAEVDAATNGDYKLEDIHNYLWLNGNVPIGLLRAEYLEKQNLDDALVEQAAEPSLWSLNA
jgi:Bacterial protein of unknown function (DUF885)